MSRVHGKSSFFPSPGGGAPPTQERDGVVHKAGGGLVGNVSGPRGGRVNPVEDMERREALLGVSMRSAGSEIRYMAHHHAQARSTTQPPCLLQVPRGPPTL
jgi:hypothetical protein